MISAVDLKYFMEVAKLNHVSKAAHRLGVTQPTLSHCLKKIEEDLLEINKKFVKKTH